MTSASSTEPTCRPLCSASVVATQDESKRNEVLRTEQEMEYGRGTWMYMWLCIVICGAVAHHHVTMMFCLFGCPLPPFFLLSPHFIQFSPSISLHYPILHLAQGRKKTTDGTGTASSKANIKTGQFPSSPTDPVALDTGTAERVLPPEIVRRIEY